MKQFIFAGVNSQNKSRTAWKIWKIERKGSEVTVWWGPAHQQKRDFKPVNKAGRLRRKRWRFRSEAAAKEAEMRRIQEKLNKGYQRFRRRARR